MKHPDKSGITTIDWPAIIASLPPVALEAFRRERAARAERATRLLSAYERGEGGLTTYDPGHKGWISGEEAMLRSFGEYIERGDMYRRERELGCVEAAKSII